MKLTALLISALLGMVLSPGSQPMPVIDVRTYGALPDDGIDDTAAIQAAIDAARIPGQTIQFPPGTFHISRALNPRGFGRVIRGTTTLRYQEDSVVAENATILQATGKDHFIFHFRGKDLTLSRLSFHGRGIFCDTSDGSMVQGLIVENCWFHLDVTGQETNAIVFTTGLRNSRISDCVFNPLRGDNGIYGYNWDGLTIANNHFLNGNQAIHVIAHQDDSRDLLIEQNYFAGLRRMGVEVQGGGINTIVQDNYYEKPVMSGQFEQNMSTFAYSIIADRSRGTRVRRNTSIAPERPDGTGVRIIFELGGQDVVCEDNYSVAGNHVAILNTSRNGKIINNRFVGYLIGPSAYPGRAVNATVQNNGPEVELSWDINRGKPGPNRRVASTRPR
ncbi:MAG TPA: right-handed parallel beta-helix repeat-containing protein [Tepidisphaeraceae bacterium]|nr:right-handed parallel beta-helix repeat-containing protein [Tepidisphaeraceae bacterium]